MLNLFGANGLITQFFGGSVNKREEIEELIKKRLNESSNPATQSTTNVTAKSGLMVIGVALIAALLLRR